MVQNPARQIAALHWNIPATSTGQTGQSENTRVDEPIALPLVHTDAEGILVLLQRVDQGQGRTLAVPRDQLGQQDHGRRRRAGERLVWFQDRHRPVHSHAHLPARDVDPSLALLVGAVLVRVTYEGEAATEEFIADVVDRVLG